MRLIALSEIPSMSLVDVILLGFVIGAAGGVVYLTVTGWS